MATATKFHLFDKALATLSADQELFNKVLKQLQLSKKDSEFLTFKKLHEINAIGSILQLIEKSDQTTYRAIKQSVSVWFYFVVNYCS